MPPMCKSKLYCTVVILVILSVNHLNPTNREKGQNQEKGRAMETEKEISVLHPDA